MISALRRVSDPLFESLERRWNSDGSRRWVGSALAVTFCLALVAIEINRQGWLPPGIGSRLPSSHFQAIHLAFTLLLLFEVVALVFSLVRSVANSVGRQFEVLSLILLRRAFEELGSFARALGEPPDQQVLLDGEVGEDAAMLRNQGESLTQHRFGSATGDLVSVEPDGARFGLEQPRDRVQ